MEFSLENMCRTCLNEDGMMYSVFSAETQNQRNKSYADMLMTCASVKVSEADGLPKLICEQCMKQLLVAFSFKKQSEQSDATLREITKNPNIEFIKEEMPDMYTGLDDLIQEDIPLESEQESKELKLEETIKAEILDFKLTKEFLEDEVILDYDVDGEDFKLDVKPINKRNFTPFKHIKLASRVNKSRDKGVVCPYCEHKFKTKQEFLKHKRTHIMNYSCQLCEKQFRSAHGLAYHTKIHKGIKNFACHFEDCNRRFTLKQALQKHLSVHTQEKNHLCSECGKTYSTYDALHYHIRTHKGERPYLCMHCGKTFKQSCHLKSHMWVHNGIKPHACKTCGKCYTSGHQLKKHLTKYCSNNIIANTSTVTTSNDYDEDGEVLTSINGNMTLEVIDRTVAIDEELLAVIVN